MKCAHSPLLRRQLSILVPRCLVSFVDKRSELRLEVEAEVGNTPGLGFTSTRLLLESVWCGWDYGCAHTCIYIGETVMKLYS